MKTMTNREISRTWEVNLLPYIKIQERGKKDITLRRKNFVNWLDILVERGNIPTKDGIKYEGEEI